MNKKLNILLFTLAISLLFSSCDDLLTVDSQRLTAEDEFRLTTPSDSVYTMFGLF